MRILAIISGEYGARHVENIRRHGPQTWLVEVWQAPANFPLMIDYPEDFLPAELPAADLILAFGEHKGVAELLPEIIFETVRGMMPCSRCLLAATSSTDLASSMSPRSMAATATT